MNYPQCSATRKVTFVDKNNNVEKQNELDIADQLAQLHVAENGIPRKPCIKTQSNNRIIDNKLKRRVSFPAKMVDVREYLPESDNSDFRGPQSKRRRLNDDSKEKQRNPWCPPPPKKQKNVTFTRNQVQQCPAKVSNQQNPFNLPFQPPLPPPTVKMFCYSPPSTPQSRRRSAWCANQRTIHNALTYQPSTNQNMQKNIFGYQSSHYNQIQQSSRMFATQCFSTYGSFFGGIYMRNR